MAVKYYTDAQIQTLRATVKERAGPRDWLIFDVLLSAGLRVSEVADLRCGDVKLNGQSVLHVRCGKGCKERDVEIPSSLALHFSSYMEHKKFYKQAISADSHVFVGRCGHLTRQGIEEVVKKWLYMCGLYEKRKLCHALRHSYAVKYYKCEHDIRGLQKQLGHSSIQTTTIYADVTREDIQRSLPRW